MLGRRARAKTMLARRLPTILPPLSLDESSRSRTVWSVAGLLPARSRPRPPTVRSRPSPYGLGGGPDRRRPPAPSGRGEPRAPRRALPRRAAGVLPACARGAPPAPRGRQRHDLARGGQRGLSRALPDDRRRQSVPARLRVALDLRLHGGGSGATTWPASRGRSWTGSISTWTCRGALTRALGNGRRHVRRGAGGVEAAREGQRARFAGGLTRGQRPHERRQVRRFCAVPPEAARLPSRR